MNDQGREEPPTRSLKRGFRTIGLLILLFFLFVFGITLVVEDVSLQREKIALVRIEGVILDPREVIAQLRRYGEDPAIRAIVVRIDSPGGAVVPSQEIYATVKRIRDEQQKTVIASMGNMAASGGYYIASAANTIVANPGTLTGSIGVIFELTNVEELLKKIGVESSVIKSGALKDLASPFRPMSDEARRVLQLILDDVHDQFIRDVAAGRDMALDQVSALADGRVFTGQQALAVNLVDRLGTLQDAIRMAADLLGITGEPTVVEAKPRFSFQKFLREQIRGAIASLDTAPVMYFKYPLVP